MTGSDELFHLALPDDWSAAVVNGEYRMSTRGRTLDEEGYIHCSYPHQVLGVARRFYADVDEVIVLRLDPARLEVRPEPPAVGIDELFPHVYGPIPVTAVVEITPWRRSTSGWEDPPTG